MTKHDAVPTLTLRVLGYREGKEWAAHCLETDLVGRGRTFKAALDGLVELTEMQISFALAKGQPALLDHPASPDIWEVYTRLAHESLRNLQKPILPGKALGSLPLPTKVEQKERLTWCGA